MKVEMMLKKEKLMKEAEEIDEQIKKIQKILKSFFLCFCELNQFLHC